MSVMNNKMMAVVDLQGLLVNLYQLDMSRKHGDSVIQDSPIIYFSRSVLM